MLHTLAGITAVLAALVARWLVRDDDRPAGPPRGCRLWDWDGEPTPPVPRGGVMVTRHDDDRAREWLLIEVGGGRLHAALLARRGAGTPWKRSPN